MGTNITHKFEPMPKRFMVWSVEFQKFITMGDLVGTATKYPDEFVMDISDMREIYEQYDLEYLIVCQSTNLFDKDGKEIFEGSIVRWSDQVGVVECRHGKWVFHVATTVFNVRHELSPLADRVKVLGHVVSNPELLSRSEEE